MKILVVDVGGTHVKILATGQREHRQADSGPTMTARRMVSVVKGLAADWSYDHVAIGYPGAVVHGHPVAEPRNLGHGWVGFDFRRAFGRPVKVINDAAMQALGSYRGGRMLFLGLGTGLGSALIIELADARAARTLEADLRAIPGVVDTGLFLGTAERVLVGYPDGRVDLLQTEG